MNRVTLTDQSVRCILDSPSTDLELITFPAGMSRLMDHTEWLVHSTEPYRLPDGGRPAQVIVTRAATPAGLCESVHSALVVAPEETLSAAIGIGVGPATGNVAGLARTPDGVAPLDIVGFVARGLPFVELRSGEASPLSVSFWSRTIGALGEVVWRQLQRLHAGVVGCGRSGSLVITSLSRMGVRITAIDPDRVEPHNLGEMPVLSIADLGKTKTEAIRDAQSPLTTDATLTVASIPDSVTSLSALAALKRAEVIVCCVDSASARLAVAVLAAAYCKPLLDVGTAVFLLGKGLRHPGGLPARRMGADIRLVLPGSCLLCCGGINGFPQARSELLAGSSPLPVGQDLWHNERDGSLLSLNSIAVHLALRLLEDLIGGRVGSNVWLHLEFNDAGIPTIESRTVPVNSACALCAATASGDRLFGEFATSWAAFEGSSRQIVLPDTGNTMQWLVSAW